MGIPINEWWFNVIVVAGAYADRDGNMLILNNGQKVHLES